MCRNVHFAEIKLKKEYLSSAEGIKALFMLTLLREVETRVYLETIESFKRNVKYF
jgi:hypothetical protein